MKVKICDYDPRRRGGEHVGYPDGVWNRAASAVAVAWRRWRSRSAVLSLGEVSLRGTRLVLRWATVSACYQPPRITQPGHPFVDRRDKYQRKLGAYKCWSGVALAMRHRLSVFTCTDSTREMTRWAPATSGTWHRPTTGSLSGDTLIHCISHCSLADDPQSEKQVFKIVYTLYRPAVLFSSVLLGVIYGMAISFFCYRKTTFGSSVRTLTPYTLRALS